jgi:hypothetical protein
VAELVDALASGASVLRDVKVQVLSSVPTKKPVKMIGFFVGLICDLNLHEIYFSKFEVEGRAVSEVKESSVSYFLERTNGGGFSR